MLTLVYPKTAIHPGRGSAVISAEIEPPSLDNSAFAFAIAVGKTGVAETGADRQYPQRFTSCMKGTSESPCTTASLCMTTAVSFSPIAGSLRRDLRAN